MKTELSTVIDTDAKVDMKDIANIFLTKYEKDLYAEKQRLSTLIKNMTTDMETTQKMVMDKADFTKYENLEIKLLDLASKVSAKRRIDWTNNRVSAVVSLFHTGNGSRQIGSVVDRTVYAVITKADIKVRAKQEAALATLNLQLRDIIGDISGMDMKAREINGRISEKLLEEKGLGHFLNSPDMAKLIQIK